MRMAEAVRQYYRLRREYIFIQSIHMSNVGVCVVFLLIQYLKLNLFSNILQHHLNKYRIESTISEKN